MFYMWGGGENKCFICGRETACFIYGGTRLNVHGMGLWRGNRFDHVSGGELTGCGEGALPERVTIT